MKYYNEVDEGAMENDTVYWKMQWSKLDLPRQINTLYEMRKFAWPY